MNSQKIYTLINPDLTISLKLVSKMIEKAQGQLNSKELSTSEITSDGKKRRIPNLTIPKVKKTVDIIKELKIIREDIKRKYKESKVETLLVDLEQLKKDLNDREIREHISTVAGITEERPSLKKLINLDAKKKNNKNNENNENGFDFKNAFKI